jgi:hypothetical protein
LAVVGIEYPEANDIANVPAPVIGLPEILNPVGTVKPTLVTEPEPEPESFSNDINLLKVSFLNGTKRLAGT